MATSGLVVFRNTRPSPPVASRTAPAAIACSEFAAASYTSAPHTPSSRSRPVTAAFTVPSSLLNGANTISAIGNESRVSTVAPLTGQLPVAAQYYFAGVVSNATEQSFIDLLNPLGQPTDVQLTFFFTNGATDTKVVTLGPTSEKDLSVAGLEQRSGTFGLSIKADRQIGAQITLTRPGQDGDTLLANTSPDTRWYLAEGYTGPTFHETVAILNSNFNAPAHVTLHLLPSSGHARRDVPVTVPPHSTSVTDVNRLLPGRSLSIFATSDRPVVVERTLTFGKGGYGMTTRAGTNTPATTWIFAEGTTVNRLQTFLSILNPNTIPTRVTASFFGRTGEALGNKSIVVAGLSRANIKLNDFLGASGIASVLTSDLPIVAERSEYFGAPTAPGIAGSDVFGSNGAGVSWSFWLTVSNWAAVVGSNDSLSGYARPRYAFAWYSSLSTQIRNGRSEKSTFVTSSVTNSAPNRFACRRKSSIIAGPMIPSGYPG